MRKIFFAIALSSALLFVLSGTPAGAEETRQVSSGTLRLTIAPSFGFQVQKFDSPDTGKVMAVSAGMGLEYGATDWFCAQALWLPGINAWSKMDGGTYGRFSDAFLGMKFGIIGENALVVRDNYRLAIAAGVITPLPSTDGSDHEGDYHLWGTALQFFYDRIVTPLFYLNLYAEFIYFPDQRLIGPNFTTRSVYHPLDMTYEADFRFRYAVQDKNMVLNWGFPQTIFFSPWINRNDPNAMDTMVTVTTGLFFTASFTGFKVPFDISLIYKAPILGRNVQPVQRLSILGRLYFSGSREQGTGSGE